MKNQFTLLMCLIGFLLISGSANGEKTPCLIEKVSEGSINWTKGFVQAKGFKPPENRDFNVPGNRQKTLTGATQIAFDKLLGVVKQIQINNELKIKDLDANNTAIRDKIEHMVKLAKIVEQKYLTDGKVEVTVQMDLRGGFAQLVLPKEIKQIDDIKVITPPIKNPSSSVQTPESITLKNKKDFFTGLIIDAIGIHALPCLTPIVLDENGKRVYGPAFISRESAVQYGTSEYEKNIQSAKLNPRVGANPLIVKGLHTEGLGFTNIIISNTDALMLRSRSEHLTFLKKCQVVIVIDELKKAEP